MRLTHLASGRLVRFTELFDQTRKLWPDVIDVADGELRDGDGGYFPNLSKLWSGAETQAKTIGPWHDLMVWAQFCGLHRAACSVVTAGGTYVGFTDVDCQYVKEKLIESLNADDSGYESIRSQFVDDADAES